MVKRRLRVAAEHVLRRTGPVPNWEAGEGSVVHPEGQVENTSSSPSRVRIGRNSHVRGRLMVFPYSGSITVGDWTYIGVRTEIWSQHSVTIGSRVLISHGVNIVDTGSHPLDPVMRHEHFRNIIEHGHPDVAAEELGIKTAPVVIEDDVWISFGVTILRGVRIGARSVIGAGSMVLRDVPPDSVYRNEVTPVIVPLTRPP